ELMLTMTETSGGLRALVEYNTDLFEAVTIERMFGHLEVLLTSIAIDPQRQIGELPLLIETERQQMLVEWNETTADYPREQCIHELFEAKARSQPQAVAITYEDEYLSYGQLNQRANQLAHHLQRLGVRPEVLVGICVERSVEMVIGVLGVLKAGGAYLPLDP